MSSCNASLLLSQSERLAAGSTFLQTSTSKYSCCAFSPHSSEAPATHTHFPSAFHCEPEPWSQPASHDSKWVFLLLPAAHTTPLLGALCFSHVYPFPASPLANK